MGTMRPISVESEDGASPSPINSICRVHHFAAAAAVDVEFNLSVKTRRWPTFSFPSR